MSVASGSSADSAVLDDAATPLDSATSGAFASQPASGTARDSPASNMTADVVILMPCILCKRERSRISPGPFLLQSLGGDYCLRDTSLLASPTLLITVFMACMNM